LLDPSTYSLVNYREAEKVVADYKTLAVKAEEIFKKLAPEKRDAFYQLVLFPIKAGALVNELYLAAAKNALYAKQGRASAKDFAAQTRELFTADTSLMGYYNRVFANGRWSHFMDQTHLGYTTWRDPPANSLNAIKLVEPEVPNTALMGIAVEGSESVWPGASETAALPSFDVFNKQQRYIEIFNKGLIPFDFKAISNKPWIILSEDKGRIDKDKRVWVRIDWTKAPDGLSTGSIAISGTNKQVMVIIKIRNEKKHSIANLGGFVEGDGYVSMEAEHFTRKQDWGIRSWIKIEDYGHTLSGMRAIAPATAPAATPAKDAPCLEYKMFLFSTGTVKVQTVCSPVLNFMPGRGIRYSISIDNEEPQMVTLVPEKYDAQNRNRDWEKSVSDNARFGNSSHTVLKAGSHTLKIWMVDQGVVIQKIVVDMGGVKPSYLGPPESFYTHIKNMK
jgi:hypothetical protein